MRSGCVSKVGAGVTIAILIGTLGACGGGSAGGGTDTPTVEEGLGLEPDGVLKRQGQAENLIPACMRAQGFEYVPVDPVAQQNALVGSAGLSEQDFEKQYGYGITTLYEQRQQTAAGPNEGIRNALDASQRSVYDRALYGDDTTATFAQALDTGDYTHLGGCVKQAADKVFGGVGTFQTLVEKLDELDARILADTRMVDAVKQWSACMRVAGFDLPEQDEVDSTLQAKLEEIVGPPGSRIPDYDGSALTALQREEVAMVTADLACEKKHVTAVEEKVRSEYESTFRQQNQALMAKVPPP